MATVDTRMMAEVKRLNDEDLPCAVRDIENLFIPLADGKRLAARAWLPEDADTSPVPAIFEYIPYRKRDFMRARDEPMHRYVAAHGYACIRVDLRGSGDSDGILADEYLPQEQQDALDVIDWLAAQPWCDGNVGMTGISWGGFNALQVAAHAPPHLKAIITLCASDDRYADDAHYMGGCLLNENQIWGTVLFALNALPPDPVIVGDAWRQRWFERLEANRPFPAVWLGHQARDDYWRQGSVCEHPERIRCAVYAIGGWADGYSNAVPRLLARLHGERKGLIGPWAHTFPHDGVPGPAVGYLQEALRWWDRHLKGRDTGIDAEPMLRAWLQDAAAPAPLHSLRNGRWVAEPGWPPPSVTPWALHLGDGVLADTPDPAALPRDITSPQTTGSTSGDWCGFGAEGEAPMDQRADDGRSLLFDGAPVAEDVDLLGDVHAHLRLCADQPVAHVAVRLCAVAPDGTSSLVTYGVLNLTHRDGHATPAPLKPGRFYDVTVVLNAVGERIPAGYVLRLALSTSYWPLMWPAPSAVCITLDPAASTLELPRREPQADDAAALTFAPPETAAASSQQVALRPARFVRSYERDLTTHDTVYSVISEGGDLDGGAVVHIDAIDMDLGHSVARRFSIGENDPLSAVAEIREQLMIRRTGWRIDVDARTRLSSDTTTFRLQAWLTARENGSVVFERTWDERIPRLLV